MPISPSAAQSDASRRNGAQSTGPKTETGKQRSAANATKHGLRAERLQLTEEERQWAEDLRQSLAGRTLPSDAAERATLEALIICEIKLARLDELEMRVLDEALLEVEDGEKKRLPSLSTLDRYRGRIMRERRELETRLETFKQTRSQFTEKEGLPAEAIRYLADLAERKMLMMPANDDKCTNEPDATSNGFKVPAHPVPAAGPGQKQGCAHRGL